LAVVEFLMTCLSVCVDWYEVLLHGDIDMVRSVYAGWVMMVWTP